MRYIIAIITLTFFQFCNQQEKQPQGLGEKIAKANGLDNFEKVQMMEFVFNVQRDTAKASQRHWQWFPETNDVVFMTDSGNIKFKRYDTTTAELKKLNARFTNDEYWLVFPYHLVWDKGMQMLDSNLQTAPISGEKKQMITVKYNNTDGFTPGDVYDIYVDKDFQINEWAYHHAGSPEPSLMTTWIDYKDYNGLKLATDHRSKDGKFRIWFTEIQVKLK